MIIDGVVSQPKPCRGSPQCASLRLSGVVGLWCVDDRRERDREREREHTREDEDYRWLSAGGLSASDLHAGDPVSPPALTS